MGFKVKSFLRGASRVAGAIAPVVSAFNPAIGMALTTGAGVGSALTAKRPTVASPTTSPASSGAFIGSQLPGAAARAGAASMIEGGGGGVNIPLLGTRMVSDGEVAESCLPSDPKRRAIRELLIRASVNSGVKVTTKKILASVKLLGIEGTALALNVNRPLAAPFVQPSHIGILVIDSLSRRRRRRCAISSRDVSRVGRVARTFARLQAQLPALRGRTITVRARHKVGCRCVTCK